LRHKIKSVWNPFRKDVSPASDAPNYLLVTYDSCRFDAYQAAKTPVLDAHAVARQAFAQATYTFAAHASMFQGMLPHVFEEKEFYNRFVKQMWRVQHRKRANARLNMPPGTRSVIDGFNKLGYFTCGTGAMGWFKNNHQLLEFWQAFEYTGIDARRQVKWTTQQLQNHPERPFFAFINFGETHAPYKFDGETGLEGDALARQRHEQGKKRDGHDATAQFDAAMWQMQVDCVEFLDARMGELLAFFDRTGRDVTIVMCADHGDCFGEAGLYGHGFYHPKVMEVPMAIFDYQAKKSK
jgi:membrane-anchored protein YejM (alkaline phosphatase superfamily)